MKEDCNRGRPPCSAFLFESSKLLPIALQLALQKRLKKSGNVWYNELKSEGKLPYKSEFCEVKNNENKAISK